MLNRLNLLGLSTIQNIIVSLGGLALLYIERERENYFKFRRCHIPPPLSPDVLVRLKHIHKHQTM